MTNDEAKDAILSRAMQMGVPLTVENLTLAAAEILDPDRAFKFSKWLERNGARAVSLINTPLPVERTGKILGEIHAGSAEAAGQDRKNCQ